MLRSIGMWFYRRTMTTEGRADLGGMVLVAWMLLAVLVLSLGSIGTKLGWLKFTWPIPVFAIVLLGAWGWKVLLQRVRTRWQNRALPFRGPESHNGGDPERVSDRRRHDRRR